MQITDLAYIDDTGYHFADYPTFLAWLQDQYRSIYGSDVYLEADSQDGQFLAVLAKGYYDTAALGAAVFNSFSPSTAQGVGLSRVVKINGLRRHTETNSTVSILIVGQTGTSIVGGVVQDSLDQKWDVPDTIIPDAGQITVLATAQTAGAVNAESNTVTKIFTPTLGWQTVNNSSPAIPGDPIETDAELRVRQTQSTALPSLTVLDGTVGAVQNLPGVTKVRAYENDTNTTDGNGIPAHTICLVVAASGGDGMDIANAIARHKTPGTGTFGGTEHTVFDAHGMPLLIKYQNPISVTIKARVTIVKNSAWATSYAALIQTAVADTIGLVQIGGVVYLTKLFAPAYLFGTPAQDSFDIVSIEIAEGAGSYGASNITLGFDELAVCIAGTNVEVIVT